MDKGKELYELRKAHKECEQFLIHNIQKENVTSSGKLKKKLEDFSQRNQKNEKILTSNMNV